MYVHPHAFLTEIKTEGGGCSSTAIPSNLEPLPEVQTFVLNNQKIQTIRKKSHILASNLNIIAIII